MFPQVVQRSLAGEGEVDRGVKRLCHDFLTVEPLQVGQAVEQEGGDIYPMVYYALGYYTRQSGQTEKI